MRCSDTSGVRRYADIARTVVKRGGCTLKTETMELAMFWGGDYPAEAKSELQRLLSSADA